MFWIELLVESNIVSSNKTRKIYKEFDEVVAMIVASIKTLRSQLPKK